MAPFASNPLPGPNIRGEMTAATRRDVSWADVSVIICTKDRPEDLARAIASIRSSGPTGYKAEIIVVEEGDQPRNIPGVSYIFLPREGRGFGYARNAGLRAAAGSVVAFMDDDCEAERGWMEALIAPMQHDESILGVAGAVLVRECGPIGYAENILGFPGGGLRYLHEARGKVVPTRYLSTCNCAYRKEAVLQAGGFPEEARFGGEDFLLAERVATLGPCLYAPDAVVYHRPRGRLCEVFRWFMRRGESEIMLLHTTTARRSFRWYLLRSSWIMRLLLLVALLAWWPQLAILLPPAGILYYGLILWRFRFARAYPSHRRAWWLVPIVKVTMDLGAELGRWKGLLSRGRQ
jgi:GT2 family glycosyltransferase